MSVIDDVYVVNEDFLALARRVGWDLDTSPSTELSNEVWYRHGGTYVPRRQETLMEELVVDIELEDRFETHAGGCGMWNCRATLWDGTVLDTCEIFLDGDPKHGGCPVYSSLMDMSGSSPRRLTYVPKS